MGTVSIMEAGNITIQKPPNTAIGCYIQLDGIEKNWKKMDPGIKEKIGIRIQYNGKIKNFTFKSFARKLRFTIKK